MAASATEYRAVAADSLPYIGLRPFEAHESDRFFGRERDSDLLCDKILSGRLTILYAQSGLGKSSLLRAVVIPRLQENNERVIYFDAWAQDDPLHALKEALIAAASEAGIADAGRGSPSLTELARLVCSSGDLGLVLVLDQFEEFLVHHGQSLDPVRSELAALLRAPRLEATVVLSLREEFLAALEPLRHQILNLFQSTYRLESLPDEGLHRAIQLPAKLFGGECDRELAEKLIADLRSRNAGSSGGSQMLELPMLQLVCQQLWAHADQGRLTVALYDQLGGARQILDDYVRSLMPKSWADQRFTAQLLMHLAPSSGLKTSYAAQDLEEIAGLNRTRVESELRRLSDARILRTREHRTAERYELQHDAFIPVLHSWRNTVVDRERRFKWIRRLLLTSACVGVLTAAVVALVYYRATIIESAERRRQEDQRRSNFDRELMAVKLESKERELEQAELAQRQSEELRKQAELAMQQSEALRLQLEQWQTGGILTDLRTLPAADRKALAPGRFDVVTYYVLSRTEGEGRMDKLRDLLIKNADLLPPDYAVLPARPLEPMNERWPLTLQYAAGRDLDEAGFNTMWREHRDFAVKEWALPLPIQLRLTASRSLSGEQIRVSGWTNTAPVVLTVPRFDGQYMIRSTPAKLPPGPAREFIERYDKEWKKFSPRSFVDYRIVPAWSLPVWKLAGEKAVTPGGIAAYAVGLDLLERPETIFSAAAVNALLDHAAKTFPNTVAEVRAARGGEIGRELAIRVAWDRQALSALPHILDSLADTAQAVSTESRSGPQESRSGDGGGVQARSWLSQLLGRVNRLRGPWGVQNVALTSAASTGAGTEPPHKAFSDFDTQMTAFFPIVVYVSPELIPDCFPGNKLSPQLDEAIEALRGEIYETHGIVTPGVRFRPPESNDRLPASSIRIAVRSAVPLSRINTIRSINGADKLKSLIRELRVTLVATRGMWVTPESVSTLLKRMPPNTRDWLEKRYSITDLKRLLRWTAGPAETAEGSVRYADWLLSSLPFWTLLEEPLDGEAIRKHLAALARAADVGQATASDPALRRRIEQGADSLVGDDAGAAVAAFSEAIKRNRSAAAQEFAGTWRRRTARVWLRDLERNYPQLDNVVLDRWQQLDLVDLEKTADRTGDRNVAWQLQLYRLAAGLIEDPAQANKVKRDLLRDSADADLVSVGQARWLALQFLTEYNPGDERTADAQAFARAGALMTSALRRLDGPAAVETFARLADGVLKRSPVNSSWDLLEQMAQARPLSAQNSIWLEFAFRLSNEDFPQRLLRALSIVQQHEKTVLASALSNKDRAEQMEFIDYVRGRVLFTLERQGEKSHDSAEPLLRRLAASKNDGVSQVGYISLLQLFNDNGRDEEAHKMASTAAARWPDVPAFTLVDLMRRFRKGDEAGVRAMADQVGKRKNAFVEDPEWLLIGALAGTLSQSSGWEARVERFLDTDHEYRDYMRMIAYGFSPARARPWLTARAAELDPRTWPQRLRNGDVRAWREMLVGRFTGAKPAEDLLLTLADDARWEKSDLSHLPIPRRGLQCEALFYEAMLAKGEGQNARAREYLEKTVKTGFQAYQEHSMAVFLLSRPE